MADPTLPLQAALVAALKGDAGVSALVGARVYDRAPENAAFPFVSLGPERAEPFDAQGTDGREIVWQIDCWSESAGRVEARAIMAAVAARLHEGALTVSGFAFVMGVLLSQRTLAEPDGARTHGVMTFRFILHTED